MDNKTVTLIALPHALIIALLFIVYYIPFNTGLSGAEKQLLEFRPSNFAIKAKKEIHADRILTSPLQFNATGAMQKGVEDGQKKTLSDMGHEIIVSLVVISGTNKMAIINGKIVKEGEKIDDKIVVRIEKERVLLKNKALRWVHVEKIE